MNSGTRERAERAARPAASVVNDRVGEVRRAVVKVGSAVLTDRGRLSKPALVRLVEQTSALTRHRVEAVLVVSGAVAAGYRQLGLEAPPVDVVDRQAAASIGQPELMSILGRQFGRSGISIAQLLLSADDIEDRRRFLSARHTLQRLLARGIVPVINENDAVSDDEIKVGDNDHLSALTAQLVSADLLVMLTSIDGIRRDGGAGKRFTTIPPDLDVRDHLAAERSKTGVGGMQAKLAAARLASRYGIATVIASGHDPKVLDSVLEGKDVGTLFPPSTHGLSSRKRWIAVRSRSRGAVRIDDGAARAIVERGASLLPRGVVGVDGRFTKGARIEILDAAGRCIAVGLASYGAREIERVMGLPAADLERVLGYRYLDEIVHRDDLVLMTSSKPGTRPGTTDAGLEDRCHDHDR
jgi:glutamate 5-kinase